MFACLAVFSAVKCSCEMKGSTETYSDYIMILLEGLQIHLLYKLLREIKSISNRDVAMYFSFKEQYVQHMLFFTLNKFVWRGYFYGKFLIRGCVLKFHDSLPLLQLLKSLKEIIPEVFEMQTRNDGKVCMLFYRLLRDCYQRKKSPGKVTSGLAQTSMRPTAIAKPMLFC